MQHVYSQPNQGSDARVQVETTKPETAQWAWGQLQATIALRIRQSWEFDALLQTTATEVRELLDCDRLLVYQFASAIPAAARAAVRADGPGRVVLEAIAAAQWSLRGQGGPDVGWASCQWATFQESQVRAIAAVATADLPPDDRNALRQLQVQAILAVPLLKGSQPWGVLIAHQCTGPRSWHPDAIAGMVQVAVLLGIALQQAALFTQLQATQTDLEAQVAARTLELERSPQRLATAVQKRQPSTMAGSVRAASPSENREAFLRQVLDSLFTFVGVLSPAGILWEANQAPLDIAGLSRAEVIDRPFADAYWWAYAPAAQAQIRGAIAQASQGLSCRFDIAVQVRGGNFITIDFALQPLRDGTGNITHLIASGIDITDRKQTERDLQTKTAELKQFFFVALDLLCIADTEGYFRRLNREWEKTLGFKVEALENTPFLDYVHPDDRASTQEQMEKLNHQQVVLNFVNRYRCRDGSYRWLEWRSLPQGNLIYAAARDITDRKQAELALKQSEARYRHIIETTLEGVWILDAEDKTTFVNQRVADMLGYQSSEMLGTTWMDFIKPEDQPQAHVYLEHHPQGIQKQLPCKFCCADGTARWVIISSTPLSDEQGNYTGMIGLLTDITQLVTIQEALQTSEMHLSSVLDSSLDGIMAFRSVRDTAGTIVDFECLLINPTACALVQRSAHELIGKRLRLEMSSSPGAGLFEDYVQVVALGHPCRREFHYRHAGTESWFESVAVKLGDGFAVTFRDVTAIKQSEQALQQVNQQLESRVADLNQRHAEMVILGEISDFLQACLTVTEACQALSTLLVPLFPGCAGGIFITHASRDRVELISSWGEALPSATDFHPQSCWALRRGRLHACDQTQAGLRCQHIPADRAIATTLCIPLIAQGEILGLFYLGTQTPTCLSTAQQQLARTVAEQVALAIANLNLRETLHHQSIRDPLTGLFNRRYLEETLAQELARAQRHQYEVGVIMLDVDHFKRFNDTFGHEAGDHVLQQVGTLLKDSVRDSDIACRYGGEEMTLVLPDSPLAVTQQRAEAIRAAIAQLVLTYQDHGVDPLTVSLGVASFPQHGGTGAAVVQAADAALYRAKAAGRNQVVLAPYPAIDPG